MAKVGGIPWRSMPGQAQQSGWMSDTRALTLWAAGLSKLAVLSICPVIHAGMTAVSTILGGGGRDLVAWQATDILLRYL